MQKAISICFKKYVDFSGRATRSEYWFFYLFFWLVYLAVRVIEKLTGSIFLNLVLSFSLLGLLPPLIAAGVRRVHDVGKPGWYAFIPIYNIVLYCTETTADDAYRQPTRNSSGVVEMSISQPISGTERPGRAPTIVISILFGPFGAIPANNAAKQARERGYPAQPYWTAFWVSWLASSAAVVLVSIAVSLAFLGLLVHGSSNNSAVASPQTTVSTQSTNCSAFGYIFVVGEICSPPVNESTSWYPRGFNIGLAEGYGDFAWNFVEVSTGYLETPGSSLCPDARPCVPINVIARKGCPSGINVQANLSDAGGKQIGDASAISEPALPFQIERVFITSPDASWQGMPFVYKMTC